MGPGLVNAETPSLHGKATPREGGGAENSDALRLLVVTGLSGAGKSGALKLLEDLGYEAVDNLPLSLLRPLAIGDAADLVPQGGTSAKRKALAVGIDSRTRDFDATRLVALLDDLKARPELDIRLIYLDCDDEILQRRFTATRRRHPLAYDRPVADGITTERALLGPAKARADQLIDTTAMALPDLRRMLGAYYTLDRAAGLSLSIVSFSYRLGLPREADLVFDVRFLRNPYYDEKLQPRAGDDAEVGAYIAADPDFAPFFERLADMVQSLLPRYDAEGKRYLTIALGCTGGRHRSVFVAEMLAKRLRDGGYGANLRHRDREAGGEA